MKHEINGKEVNIEWEQDELIDRHDSGFANYSVNGIDDDGNEYEAIGDYLSGELEDVNEIELIQNGN